ncbi:MAG: DUF1549 and DUF1553 domain-containing protein [Pirellulales bacterium]
MKVFRAAAVSLAVAVALSASHRPRAAETSADLKEVPITDDERSHWAYLPIGAFEPPVVNDARWRNHPIDAFVKSAMDANSVEPLPPAGKAILLRRVSFDLAGLPPTPKQIEEFLADDSPDAYEKLVDRLLASPAYGERFAQHWLDLARFAETDGFEHDLERPNAWRYRDWVIDALNRDMPYDEFIRLQLAGDELFPDDPQAAVATGFLLCGPDMPDINLQEERRHVVLNEMAATVGSVFLAVQFGCAQCHDHKYDPIRIQDFYRLRAFFESATIFRDHPIPTAGELAARRAAEAVRDPKYREADARREELETIGRERFRQKNPDVYPTLKQILGELGNDYNDEHRQLARLLKDAPPLPRLAEGRVMRDGEPREAHVWLRGDFRQPGPVVNGSFPRILAADGELATERPDRPRAELARWLTKPDHPLVARVIVNRLWQWHFGVGLAANPSDFGVMGAEPTHPELLDWLARRFVADGWSFKSMHRLIVTSRAYRLACAPFDAQWSAEQIAAAREIRNRSQAADPQNAWLWRRSRRRLEGEAIRDAMLVACDKLSVRTGGPGIRPPLAPEVTETLLKDQWNVSGDGEDHRRRGIYLFVRRNLRYPLFDVFDRPDTNASCAMRHESTTATQSLTQFNSQLSLECARWLAGAVAQHVSGTESDSRAIRQAYWRVFNRPAGEDEIRRGREFLSRQAQRLRDEGRQVDSLALPLDGPKPDDPLAAAALVDFCLALFNANEFLYLD